MPMDNVGVLGGFPRFLETAEDSVIINALSMCKYSLEC